MTSAQILIVEDERLIARCMKKELEGMGYGVPGIASSGEEALAKFDETRPDLVLMDIVLKGNLDGIETTRQLRTRSRVPVVYLSGQRDPQLVERAKATEPLGFLLKPYEENGLRATIEMALHRHRLEQRVQDTEKWLSGTLSALSDAVIATDILQRIGFMNPAAECLTGWNAALAQECDLERVVHILSGEIRSAVAVTERKTMETGVLAPLPARSVLFARNGRQIPVAGSCAPIVSERGSYIGFVWVLRELAASQDDGTALQPHGEKTPLHDARPALGDPASALSHEFNNLLTMILGNASLMLCGLPENDKNFQGVINIHAAALRAMNLAQRSQGRGRRRHRALGPVSLQAALQQICATLPRLISSAIDLEYRSAENLWPVRSSVDLLEELVLNLCLGACETMPQGGKMILETENISFTDDDVLFHYHARAGDFVRLRLRDDGVGLSRTARAQLVEHEGSAAGPAGGFDTVRDIVRRHDGWIECFSEPGNGTRFDVYLTRGIDREPRPTPASPAPSQKQPRRTVLLVDDEQMLRDLGRNILRLGGFDVLLAEDGRDAVRVFAREKDRIGVVVLDLTMPRLSGDDTFAELLRIDPDVRVLFCSGYPEDNVKSLGHRQVCGFITKPYRNEELLEAVRLAIEERNEA